jgi:N-acetylglucosaminyldiphosphoundecaprenol N-acetyl-beta-D-mannosaminyltransferase
LDNIETIRILNFWVNNFDKEKLVKFLISPSNDKTLIANHNLHSLYYYNKDLSVWNFYKRANYIHVDGMPIIWLSWFTKNKLKVKNRLTYLDWIYDFFAEANKSAFKIFFLGSRQGVGELVSEKLRKRFPKLLFSSHHGFFDKRIDSADNKKVIEFINNFNPDVLFVGLGTPVQEKWILENINNLKANTILQCGACFEYIAGKEKKPPRILGRMGLEWAFRFFYNPKKFYNRYLFEPIWLIFFYLFDGFSRKNEHD